MNNPGFALTKSSLPTTSSISIAALKQLSSLYHSVLLASPQQKRHKVSPTELQRLDTRRYEILPQIVAGRVKKDANVTSNFLTKSELQDLVAWKLARGVYRPTLPSLIASNSEEYVIEVTENALKQYEESASETVAQKAQTVTKALCDLRGVGPATASLLLSVAQPESVPFFSDELFYWTAATGDNVKLEKIKYNMKEYGQLVKEVNAIQDRLGRENEGERPRADDIERVAFVVQKLQNPDIWEAVVGETKDVIQTNLKDTGDGENTGEKVAELDEANPPTNERTDLDEEEKREEIKEKKEILLQHGANVKNTTKTLGKRSRSAEDQPPPRRSTRARK